MKSAIIKSSVIFASFGAYSIFVAANPAPASVLSPKAEKHECVVIDNDFDIDDMMAIPLVLGNKHVAAIVQTEGYTLPERSAPAVDRLINQLPDQPQNRKIPIIVGGKQLKGPDLKRWPWLPFFRSMMNRANGLMPNELAPWPANDRYSQAIAESVKDCKNVSVLIIGTYTSFNNYLPLIKSKLDRVVIMGQEIGDESRTPGRESFNCDYDLDACKKAMPELKTLKTIFVDIPRLDGCRNTTSPASHCYSPSLTMVTGDTLQRNDSDNPGLLKQGLPGQLRRALINNINCSQFYSTPETIGRSCSSVSTWEPKAVATGPGGEMLLWDQTAAVFMVNPELFSLYYPPASPQIGAKHYEPSLLNGSHEQTVQRLRHMWTRYTNEAIRIK